MVPYSMRIFEDYQNFKLNEIIDDDDDDDDDDDEPNWKETEKRERNRKFWLIILFISFKIYNFLSERKKKEVKRSEFIF